MNHNNYASLEASKRLAEAGIVLLYVDKAWIHDKWKDTWELGTVTPTIEFHPERWEFYMAPMWAEVWRELPKLEICITKHDTLTCIQYGGEFFRSINPADALIDLLIWVRKEATDDRH